MKRINPLADDAFRRGATGRRRALRAVYRQLPLPRSFKARCRDWLVSHPSLVRWIDAPLRGKARSAPVGGASANPRGEAETPRNDLSPSPKSPVTVVPGVEIDWTRLSDYGRLKEEEIDEYSHIEVTENLREGGIHAQKAWGFWFGYLSEHVWKTSLTGEVLSFCGGLRKPRILSLGCGYGGIELEIARSLKSDYQITAVDLNPSIFARAEAEVRAGGLHVQFVALDLNFVDIRERSFDLVFAHASLHHLLNLEHVFSQIYHGLDDGGRLIVQDVIGKTQVLFWKENVDFAIHLVSQMPARYNAGIVLPAYSEPSLQRGMEGIRQEEIEELLSAYFVPVKMFKYGSFMRMICTHRELGRRFDPDLEEDRQYLERISELDLQQVAEGKLRPTEMMAVFEKRPSVKFDWLEAQARARIAGLFAQQGDQPGAFRHAEAALARDPRNELARGLLRARSGRDEPRQDRGDAKVQ